MRRPPKMQKTLYEMLYEVSDGLNTSITSIYSYVPHEKQKWFHSSDKLMKLLIGGNRSGKTVSNVVECIWRLMKKHPFRPELNEIEGPIRGRMVVTNFTEGLHKIALPLFKKWIPVGELIDRSWDKSYDKSLRTLTLANGSFIEFMSYDQDLDAFAGTSRHFCSFDEEPPRSIFNECMMRLIDTMGSWFISMTPVEGLTWIFSEVYEPFMEEGKNKEYLDVIKVSIHDNPHISQEAINIYFAFMGMDADERHAREEGNFFQMGGRVYKTFDKRVHGIKAEDFELTADMRIWTSLDSGWTHPAAWLWHCVDQNGYIVTFHEIVKSETTVEQFAVMVKEYEDSLRKKYYWFKEVYSRTGDPALKQTKEQTGTSVLQEYAKHGIYIGVKGVPRSVDIGVIRMTQYLDTKVCGRQMWTYTDDCVTLERQMKSLHWEKYASKKLEYEKAPKITIDKKDDDAPDSLRYFITLCDDLTPEKIAGIQKAHDLLGSVPYYSGRVPPTLVPDYQTYSGSLLTNLEG